MIKTNEKSGKVEATKNAKKNEKSNLEISIAQFEEQLEAEIEKGLSKKKLIDDRAVFMQNKDLLVKWLDANNKEEEANDLNSEEIRIRLSKGRYSHNDDLLSFNNKLIINEFIQFTIGKIDLKVKELEKQIIAA